MEVIIHHPEISDKQFQAVKKSLEDEWAGYYARNRREIWGGVAAGYYGGDGAKETIAAAWMRLAL